MSMVLLSNEVIAVSVLKEIEKVLDRAQVL